jgi:peptidoglycan/xylan/chitin deacetylase (PgdA/CDA1 family)
MTSTGLVTVGSHTHTHALLDRVDVDDARSEIARSASLIQDHLGQHAAHFAYPKAVAPSVAVEALVRDQFRSAALAGTRPNVRGQSDLHRLARSPVQVGDGMRWFSRKLEGGLAFEDTLRRTINHVRYAHALK